MRIKIAVFVINIITLLLLVATCCVASGEQDNGVLVSANRLNAVMATNYLDRVETSLKYAKQLRDAGYLGAAIDIIIEAIEDIRGRSLSEAAVQVVTVTQSCQRAHCDTPGPYGIVTNSGPYIVPSLVVSGNWDNLTTWPGTYSTSSIVYTNADYLNVEAP